LPASTLNIKEAAHTPSQNDQFVLHMDFCPKKQNKTKQNKNKTKQNKKKGRSAMIP